MVIVCRGHPEKVSMGAPVKRSMSEEREERRSRDAGDLKGTLV